MAHAKLVVSENLVMSNVTLFWSHGAPAYRSIEFN
jgi:hypothetical protein